MSARDEAVEMISRICPAHLSADEYGQILAEKFDAHRTEVLAEVTAWLVKKAREFRAGGRKADRAQADTAAVLASKIARGAVRPDNLRMLPDPGFFEVDRTYRREHHGQPILFVVSAVSVSPDGQRTIAHGWRSDPYSSWEPSDSDDLTGWTDVTGEVTP